MNAATARPPATAGALFAAPAHSVDERTAQLLDLIAGDPVHAGDRARIVAAIVRDARDHGGRVDTNRVRARLADDQGRLQVYPRVIGAVISALARSQVLVPAGFVVSTDRAGRNSGRPLRAWRLTNRLEQTEIPVPDGAPSPGASKE